MAEEIPILPPTHENYSHQNVVVGMGSYGVVYRGVF
jgi:hypothetical protein